MLTADGSTSPQARRWFMSGSTLDETVIERFGGWIEPAAGGTFDHWRETPLGSLALILLLDQFPRHVWRGQARAFDYGDAGLACCEAGLAAGQDQALPITQRVFFYLPLEHSETLVDQERSLALYGALQSAAPASLAEFAERTWESAVEHHDIVQRFGRYPHRNSVLGRESTAEEAHWLESGAGRFGQ